MASSLGPSTCCFCPPWADHLRSKVYSSLYIRTDAFCARRGKQPCASCPGYNARIILSCQATDPRDKVLVFPRRSSDACDTQVSYPHCQQSVWRKRLRYSQLPNILNHHPVRYDATRNNEPVVFDTHASSEQCAKRARLPLGWTPTLPNRCSCLALFHIKSSHADPGAAIQFEHVQAS